MTGINKILNTITGNKKELVRLQSKLDQATQDLATEKNLSLTRQECLDAANVQLEAMRAERQQIIEALEITEEPAPAATEAEPVPVAEAAD